MDSGREDHPILIELENITFNYRERPVLKGLSFCFQKGERVGLVGPNGSGKTTLFHIIMGLLKPIGGTVMIFGKARAKERDFLEVRRRIGFVFQDPDDQLFSPTVEEDVAFGPLNLGIPHHKVKDVVHDTLSLLGLSGFEKRVTHKLSGGEKRLVSVATALAMKPEILILDEPTSGLDDETTERLIHALRSYCSSYIIASHDRSFLLEVVDTLYEMRDGKLGIGLQDTGVRKAGGDEELFVNVTEK